MTIKKLCFSPRIYYDFKNKVIAWSEGVSTQHAVEACWALKSKNTVPNITSSPCCDFVDLYSIFVTLSVSGAWGAVSVSDMIWAAEYTGDVIPW